MINELMDASEREIIVSDLDRNMLIEAGAGSGKTTSMLERMAALITSGKANVENITAITFTKKAADELRFRFRHILERKERESEAPSIERDRCRQALGKIEECFIGTVHSFCARLLRERPIEAGVDLAFREIEESEDEEILYEAWVDYYHEQRLRYPEYYHFLQSLGLSMSDLYPNLQELVRYPEVEWKAARINPPNIEEVWNRTITLCREAEKMLRTDRKKADPLEEIISQILMAGNVVESDADKILALEGFQKQIKVTHKNWHTKEDAKYFKDQFQNLKTEEIELVLQQWHEYTHFHILTFLQGAMEWYERAKQKKAMLNYQDLLLKTKKLLQSHVHVRIDLQRKYRFLFVDEFQDTDPIQAEIMFLLTAEDPSMNDWRQCRPRNGALFIVGDPKQSIYRFRRADIDMYLEVKKKIHSYGGAVLTFTTNFRTISEVTTPLNRWLENVFPSEPDKYQAAFQPLNPVNNGEDGAMQGVYISEVAHNKTTAVVEENDAEQIAFHIKHLLNEGYKFEDILILQRYNKPLTKYAAILEQHNIPVNVSGEIYCKDIPEFKDLASVFEAIADGNDERATTAALKNVYFGVSDVDLYEWKHAGGGFFSYSDSPLAGKNDLEESLAQLHTYQKIARRTSVAVAMIHVIKDLGMLRHIALNHRGKEAKQGYDHLIETLAEQSFSTLSEGETWYKTWLEQKQRSLEQNVEKDAVRVMNVHKAKGLEAPVVFLANPSGYQNNEDKINVHIQRKNQAAEGYVLFEKPHGPYQKKTIGRPLNWAEAKSEEITFQDKEEFRLLYVAATRAERMLIISSSSDNSKNCWQPLLDIQETEIFHLQEPTQSEVRTNTIIHKQRIENARNNEHDADKAMRELITEEWSPTKDKEQPLPAIAREEGGGTERGTFIHQVLEQVVKGRNVQRFIPNLAHQQGFTEKQIKQAFKIVEQFQNSTVYHELQNAQAVYTEWPFNLELTPHDEGYSDLFGSDQTNKRLKGYIDLVYLTEDGWKIIDYKTDRYEKEEEKEKLEAFYQDQLDYYKIIWEVIMGEEVHAAELYFTEEKLILK
ncbi:UvrD-helicase domain-containing protein [Natribacillus halophilus]|uniref:DNA 3'-5' helicase n=1 Tax=Natribacillus halophilus TaxID=549003 RepID=A0A1G8LAZ1_9BACI|nr:UvrD-helicase domain-containing protein [Natribacillus halophilus]SDI52825.1 ATP-dependent helicase/nuclease subunit A [Natribacillus halophilus]